MSAKQLEPHYTTTVRDLSGHDVINLAVNHNAIHVVQENGLDFELENQFSKKMEQNCLDFFADPLKEILGSTMKDKLRIRFKESYQKREVVDHVIAWTSNITGAKRIMDSITLIIDELFTNAIFNALPYYVGLPRGLDRREKINLTDRKPCEIFVGYNSHRLILGCSDSFGSLNTEKLLHQILATYTKGIAGSINYESAGAEVGCRLMFDKCINYYVGVWLHEKTTVALGLPIGPKARVVDLSYKNLHLMKTVE